MKIELPGVIQSVAFTHYASGLTGERNINDRLDVEIQLITRDSVPGLEPKITMRIPKENAPHFGVGLHVKVIVEIGG